MNAPDPPHRTLNSCFGVSQFWVDFRLFHYCAKLVPKRVELVQLVQKFVPQSRIRIFCNEHTHPPHWTQNSCFIVFYTIFVHLAPFGCVPKLSAKQAKLIQKIVPRSRVGIFNSERTRSTPLDSKLKFWCVLYYLDAFGTFGCLTKLNAK